MNLAEIENALKQALVDGDNDRALELMVERSTIINALEQAKLDAQAAAARRARIYQGGRR